jgi:molybdate transport system substrate-binding protein
LTLALLTTATCERTSDQVATGAPSGEITVAAASDLRPAFEAIAADFEAVTPFEVTFTFGSSGQLREQIINGAPFDLYASANVGYVDQVIDAGKGVANSKRHFASGRLALVSRNGVALPDEIPDLTHKRYRRITIANPTHAPYGAAALQALQSAGINSEIEPKVTLATNVADALRITRSGNADVGIVALSLVIASDTPFTTIPSMLHEPIEQAMVVTTQGWAGETANAFAEYVQSAVGREILARYGYELPTTLRAPQETTPHE